MDEKNDISQVSVIMAKVSAQMMKGFLQFVNKLFKSNTIDKGIEKLEDREVEKESQLLEMKGGKIQEKILKEEKRAQALERNQLLKERNEVLSKKLEILKTQSKELKEDIQNIKEEINGNEKYKEKYKQLDPSLLKDFIKENLELKNEIAFLKGEKINEPEVNKEVELKVDEIELKEDKVINKEVELKSETAMLDNNVNANIGTKLIPHGNIEYKDLLLKGEVNYELVNKNEFSKVVDQLKKEGIEFCAFEKCDNNYLKLTEDKKSYNVAYLKDDTNIFHSIIKGQSEISIENSLNFIGDGKTCGDMANDGMGIKEFDNYKSLEKQGIVKCSVAQNIQKTKITPTKKGEKLLDEIKTFKEKNKGKSPSNEQVKKMIKNIDINKNKGKNL